jgi:hypothetical protein
MGELEPILTVTDDLATSITRLLPWDGVASSFRCAQADDPEGEDDEDDDGDDDDDDDEDDDDDDDDDDDGEGDDDDGAVQASSRVTRDR